MALLAPELEELNALEFDLGLTGFDPGEIDEFLGDPNADDLANSAPEPPRTRQPTRRSMALRAAQRLLRGCNERGSSRPVACRPRAAVAGL